MRVYLDTSVSLRRLLRQPDPLPHDPVWTEMFSSVLLRVEMRRVVDRLRLEGTLDDSGRAEADRQIDQFCHAVRLIQLEPDILERAGGTFPAVLGTLDALHLATALVLRDRGATPLTILTHDRQQALAARSLGFPIVGVA